MIAERHGCEAEQIAVARAEYPGASKSCRRPIHRPACELPDVRSKGELRSLQGNRPLLNKRRPRLQAEHPAGANHSKSLQTVLLIRGAADIKFWPPRLEARPDQSSHESRSIPPAQRETQGGGSRGSPRLAGAAEGSIGGLPEAKDLIWTAPTTATARIRSKTFEGHTRCGATPRCGTRPTKNECGSFPARRYGRR